MRKHHFYILHIGRTAYFLLLLLIVFAFLYGRFMWKDYYQSEYVLSMAMVGKVIVIDAGHGGIDPGVVGKEGTRESDINLAIAKQLAEILRQSGANVVMTREDNNTFSRSKREDLSMRLELAKKNDPDLFISIHGNSFPRQRDLSGAQIFYEKGAEESQKLAESIQAAIGGQLENSDRQAITHPDSFLLEGLDIPAVIVEVGFLSNPEEERLLKDSVYQWQMASAVYRGIVGYLTAPEENPENPQESGNKGAFTEGFRGIFKAVFQDK